MWRYGMDWSGPGKGQIVIFFEQGAELSGYKTMGNSWRDKQL